MTFITRRAAMGALGAGAIMARAEFAFGDTSAADTISLALNENPFGPSPHAVRAIQSELAQLSRYNTEAATNRLIDAIAAKERVDREHVVLGEILEPLGLHLGLERGAGGEFVYSVPGYTALIDAAATVGGKAIGVALDAQLSNDLTALRAAVNGSTRAIFVVNPHNPSGTLNDNVELKRFLQEVSSRTLAIVDEAYLEFAADFSARTAADLTRAGADVIVFRTFAKAYGLAGLDIGYGLVPKQLAAMLRSRGVGAPRSLNRLAVAAATASLGDQNFVATVRRKVAHERQQWHALLDSLRVRHTHAEGNFIFFDARRPHAEVRAALLKHDIDVGRAFAPYDTWVRISIGLPAQNARARTALQEILSGAR
jgi:histidinol-phosphate aminotransferase